MKITTRGLAFAALHPDDPPTGGTATVEETAPASIVDQIPDDDEPAEWQDEAPAAAEKAETDEPPAETPAPTALEPAAEAPAATPQPEPQARLSPWEQASQEAEMLGYSDDPDWKQSRAFSIIEERNESARIASDRPRHEAESAKRFSDLGLPEERAKQVATDEIELLLGATQQFGPGVFQDPVARRIVSLVALGQEMLRQIQAGKAAPPPPAEKPVSPGVQTPRPSNGAPTQFGAKVQLSAQDKAFVERKQRTLGRPVTNRELRQWTEEGLIGD